MSTVNRVIRPEQEIGRISSQSMVGTTENFFIRTPKVEVNGTTCLIYYRDVDHNVNTHVFLFDGIPAEFYFSNWSTKVVANGIIAVEMATGEETYSDLREFVVINAIHYPDMLTTQGSSSIFIDESGVVALTAPSTPHIEVFIPTAKFLILPVGKNYATTDYKFGGTIIGLNSDNSFKTSDVDVDFKCSIIIENNDPVLISIYSLSKHMLGLLTEIYASDVSILDDIKPCITARLNNIDLKDSVDYNGFGPYDIDYTNQDEDLQNYIKYWRGDKAITYKGKASDNLHDKVQMSPLLRRLLFTIYGQQDTTSTYIYLNIVGLLDTSPLVFINGELLRVEPRAIVLDGSTWIVINPYNLYYGIKGINNGITTEPDDWKQFIQDWIDNAVDIDIYSKNDGFISTPIDMDKEHPHFQYVDEATMNMYHQQVYVNGILLKETDYAYEYLNGRSIIRFNLDFPENFDVLVLGYDVENPFYSRVLCKSEELYNKILNTDEYGKMRALYVNGRLVPKPYIDYRGDYRAIYNITDTPTDRVELITYSEVTYQSDTEMYQSMKMVDANYMYKPHNKLIETLSNGTDPVLMYNELLDDLKGKEYYYNIAIYYDGVDSVNISLFDGQDNAGVQIATATKSANGIVYLEGKYTDTTGYFTISLDGHATDSQYTIKAIRVGKSTEFSGESLEMAIFDSDKIVDTSVEYNPMPFPYNELSPSEVDELMYEYEALALTDMRWDQMLLDDNLYQLMKTKHPSRLESDDSWIVTSTVKGDLTTPIERSTQLRLPADLSDPKYRSLASSHASALTDVTWVDGTLENSYSKGKWYVPEGVSKFVEDGFVYDTKVTLKTKEE